MTKEKKWILKGSNGTGFFEENGKLFLRSKCVPFLSATIGRIRIEEINKENEADVSKSDSDRK